MCLKFHFHLDDCLTWPLSKVSDGGVGVGVGVGGDGGVGSGYLPTSVAEPTPVLLATFLFFDPTGGEVSLGFYPVQSDFPWLLLCFPLRPELVVLLSADHQILAGQPEAVVHLDEDDGEGVVDHEDRPGGETGGEPLDENEEGVLHDDKKGPKEGDLERFREVEKISPVFASVAPEYMIGPRLNCISGA